MSRFSAVVFALILASVGASSLAQTTHAAKRVTGDAEAGLQIFQHNCLMCHAVTPNTKIVGPSLYSEMRGTHARSAAAVRDIIVHGKGQMPALGSKLSDQEIADLLAYVRKQ